MIGLCSDQGDNFLTEIYWILFDRALWIRDLFSFVINVFSLFEFKQEIRSLCPFISTKRLYALQ